MMLSASRNSRACLIRLLIRLRETFSSMKRSLKMLNKRLISVIVSVLAASVVAGCIVSRNVLTGEELIKLYQTYATLVGLLAGAYQGVQSFTDTKKVQDGTR